jgi:hypothetical protein
MRRADGAYCASATPSRADVLALLKLRSRLGNRRRNWIGGDQAEEWDKGEEDCLEVHDSKVVG